MAKKAAKPLTDAEQADIRGLNLEDAYTAEPISEALSALYSEMGIEGELASFVTVHKVIPETGKEARVWKDSVDKYDLDGIAKRFGTGEYVVRVYVQREDRSYSCRGSKTFHMMLDAADDAQLKLTREGKLGAPMNASAPAQPPLSITDILALMQKSQESTLQMLQPILAGASGAKQNSLAELKGLAEAFGMMPGKGAGGDMMQAFTMFQKFMEMANGMKPEKALTEDEVGPNALLMKGLEVFMETVKGAKNAQAGMQPTELPAQALMANAQPVAALPVRQPVLPARPLPTDEEAEMQMFLKMQLAMMLRAAANDSDVETYAALVYEQAPDDILDKLQQPEWFAQLIELEAKCATYQIWFTRLRDRVVEMIAEDAQDNALTGAANATTVAGDAAAK